MPRDPGSGGAASDLAGRSGPARRHLCTTLLQLVGVLVFDVTRANTRMRTRTGRCWCGDDGADGRASLTGFNAAHRGFGNRRR